MCSDLYIYTLKIGISVILFLYQFVNKIRVFNSCVRVGFYLEFILVFTHTSFCLSDIITHSVQYRLRVVPHLLSLSLSLSLRLCKILGEERPQDLVRCSFLSCHTQLTKWKRDYPYSLLRWGSISIMTKFETQLHFNCLPYHPHQSIRKTELFENALQSREIWKHWAFKSFETWYF